MGNRMTMNTCGTCKHHQTDNDEHLPLAISDWDEDTYQKVLRKGYGICGRIKHEENTTACKKFDGQAGVVDGSDYFAAVICRDDFGCVLHEPKIDKAQ